ncbi:MAG TPA: NAD(P)H-hydrate dehydratase [Acidobacteriaceae bacterium]|nr:NAD(P)H-hydrate dehydratase [Acidobacteriaceae bacterium]
MQILTSAEMGAADRRTAEEFGIPLATLMENAGTAVARFCLRQYPSARRVVALCGKGNNGGDGLVAARVLARSGFNVRILLLGSAGELKAEAAAAFERIQHDAPSVAVDEITTGNPSGPIADAIYAADLILDAVVGTGFKPPLRGLAAALRDLVNESAAAVVAVDLPSGWDADSLEQKADGAYRADAVVTFTAPKPAHIFGHLTTGTFGPVVVAPIGSPAQAVVSASRLHWAGAAKAIAEQPRDVNSNKGKFGHVLVVGGSVGTAGAPAMASLAAMRTGAGLVTAAVPLSIVDLVAGIAPELMLAPLKQNQEGAVAMENLAANSDRGIEALIKEKRISVIALGPGLSTRGEASKFARELVARTKLPLVVDADALNAFDRRAAELNGTGRVLVLTPHPGEMARLTGMTIQQVEADRIGLVRRFATEHNLTLVLKGWRTLIAHPDGRVAANTSGNPALAKGGSGDILTGIVAAMLAQYAASGDAESVARAVEAAVFLHGLAADLCVAGGASPAMDEHTVLATDTVSHLSNAFHYRTKDADGMTWICGFNGTGVRA